MESRRGAVRLEGSQGQRLEPRRRLRENGEFTSGRVADIVTSTGPAAGAAEEDAVAAVEGQSAGATWKEAKARERRRAGRREPDSEVAVEGARGVVGVEKAGEVLGQRVAVVGVVGEVVPGPGDAPEAAERPVREAAEDLHDELPGETAAAALTGLHRFPPAARSRSEITDGLVPLGLPLVE
jgi:hypothetical protein